MTPEIQTTLALGVVALTAGLFLVRFLRKRTKLGCASGCGCSSPRPVKKQG
jgi:hypothetical protein